MDKAILEVDIGVEDIQGSANKKVGCCSGASKCKELMTKLTNSIMNWCRFGRYPRFCQ